MGKSVGMFATVLLVGLLLAGCSGKGTDSDTGSGTAATSGSVSSHGTGANGNHPPTGQVQASVAQGAAPLRVDFTLDGTDADKDPLSWALDANGDGKVDRNGNKLPATVNYTYLNPGVFNVTYKLTDGKSDVSFPLKITVTASVVNRTVLLADGAEGDASLWTLTNEVVLNYVAGTQPTGQAHPLGGYVQDTKNVRTGSKAWHAPYPDNYLATMTTAKAVDVPTGGATLSFWIKGGAEDNGFDGLYVNTGTDASKLDNQVYTATTYKDWTQFSFHVDPGAQFIQFAFAADASCSSDPAPVGGPGACAAGYDQGGFWIDDITLS